MSAVNTSSFAALKDARHAAAKKAAMAGMSPRNGENGAPAASVLDAELAHVMDLIHSKELSPEMQERIMKESIDNWVSKGPRVHDVGRGIEDRRRRSRGRVTQTLSAFPGCGSPLPAPPRTFRPP